MPRIDCIGRKAVDNHHWQVPLHLLKEASELSVGDPVSGNALTLLRTDLRVDTVTSSELLFWGAG